MTETTSSRRTPVSAGVLLLCEDDDCSSSFERMHNSQRFCSERCWKNTRNRRKRAATPWMTPGAKASRRARDYAYRGYGITPEEFDARVEAQGSACAICTRVATLVPDHDHESRTFRGAICEPCNHMLGKAYDDPDVLEAGAAYLRRSTL